MYVNVSHQKNANVFCNKKNHLYSHCCFGKQLKFVTVDVGACVVVHVHMGEGGSVKDRSLVLSLRCEYT